MWKLETRSRGDGQVEIPGRAKVADGKAKPWYEQGSRRAVGAGRLRGKKAGAKFHFK